MRSSRLYWKLFSVAAGSAAALAAVFALVLVVGVRPWMESLAQQRLHDMAAALRTLAEGSLQAGDRDALQRAVGELRAQTRVRCTVLDASGNVLADSHGDPREMTNHGARPEIVAAKSEAGYGSQWRESDTLGVEFLYVALRVERDRRLLGFVRVADEARPLRTAWTSPLAIGLGVGAVVLVIVLAVSHAVVLRVVGPLEGLCEQAERFAASGTTRGEERSTARDGAGDGERRPHFTDSPRATAHGSRESTDVVDAGQEARSKDRERAGESGGAVEHREAGDSRPVGQTRLVGESRRTGEGRPTARSTALPTFAAQRSGGLSSTTDRDELTRLRTAFERIQGAVDAQWAGLRSSNERLLGMMRSMEEGVLALDADERIAMINEAGRRLLEMGDAEVVGRHLWELTRLRALRDAFAEAMSTGRASAKEFETTGAERHVLTLRAARLPGSPALGVMIVLHDVTELRRLENLRRDFVANVSHELKTPLASIKAYAETLRLGALHDAEHNQQFVARIEEQADRLHQLIIDLLHLARVESGQQAFDIAEVCLRTIVDASVAAHAASAASRQITLASEPPAVPIDVMADEEGVRTIVNNLVDNAIKYTPGGGKVTVRWRQESGHAILEVQDTGIGIARQHQARVFERFYRVDKARSRELGGTGLGLAIVKHLVQAFGGSVGIESQPRMGSTFRVTLPLASVNVAASDNFTDP
jgi:PAS domain S-box-containing protein